MASKVKVKNKGKKVAEQLESNTVEERPGSAHSQISVKEATASVDNTEKFTKDEHVNEKESKKGTEGSVSNKNRTETPTVSGKGRTETPTKSDKGKTDTPAKSDRGKTNTPTNSEKSPATKRKSEKVDYGYKKKHEPRSRKNIRKEEMDLPQRTPSPAPSLTPSMTPSERQKRASPFRNNTVEPVQGEPMGSSASLKSHSTFREAWIDRSDAGSEFNAASNTSSGSLVSLRRMGGKQNKVHPTNDLEDTVSQLQNTEEDEVAKNAYIPYLYARKCIANIMGDMTKMKICHVRIVEEIQTQYKSIENETQSQFNIFVVSLRQQYHDKVQTFRQVIDVHRSELQSKESYWNEMLASLAERNKRLLRDKKVLLIQNKVEIDRLEKEKVEMQTDLSQKLDKANALVVTAEKEKAEEKEKESHTHSTEVKSLQDQLESEKSNVKDLQDELAKLKVAAATGVVVAATDNDSERKETKLSEAPDKATKEDVELQKSSQVMAVAAAAGVTSTDKKKMSEERNQMEGERQKMLDERDEMEKDRENFGTERKVWLDEINMLQLQLTEQNKESAEWKAKYEAMKTQAGDSLTLKSKYKVLEDQYNALAVVVAASEGTKELAQVNAKKTESDKEMMTKEKSNIDNQIKQWETKFKKKNGREPTEDDKSDSVKEMYVQQEELTTMVTSLDKQLETFQKLENGKVPDPPEVPPVPVAIKDPEVQTVEVRVPDPVILEELKKAHEDIAKLRVQISTLQQENTECHSQISQQNEELSRQRDRISQLEAEIAVLKAGALTATVSDEELEKTKKENRDLKKDMKKLLKRMETLEEKAKTADVDPDTRVTDLEGKVLILNDKTSELESENEALKEDKLKMERDNENFQAQIHLLQQQIESSATQNAAVTVTPVAATLTRSQPGEDKDGCNIPEHADLLEQLEIKKQELENMELELQKKETVISEKILTIQDKEEEIEKLKKETKQMRADMIKMTKQHVKLQQKLKDMADYDKIKKLIEALAFYVHEIHQENPEAAEGVNKRLEAVSGETLKLKEQQEKSQKAVDAWVAKYKQKHGKEPTSKDRDAEGEKLYKLLDENTKLVDDKKIMVEALNIMKTGDYKSKQNVRRESVAVVEETTVENIEKQMSVIDTKVTVLETENDELRKERNEAVAKMKELELQVQQAQRHAEQSMLTTGITDSEELSKQISELQKQVNASEAALLQERNAHDSTKDELENLRKQMDVLREEVKNEKSDVQAKVDAQTKSMAAEMKAKDQEIKTLQSRNEQLEMERLANVPVDTAKEIQNLQNKIIILEKEKTTGETTAVGLQGQIAELKTKLEGANKNLEAQRAANRDLETKNKTAKADKEKALRENTTQIEKREQQRANEDKKRIGTLEKKIRELEAVGARPTTAAVVAGGKDTVGGGASKDQLVALKRENNELKMRIKQLENEIKQSSKFGAVGVSGADDRNEQKRKEKILKELERKYEIEKNKTSKLEESVKSTEEELKVTKKEADGKDVELKKLAAELAALGTAAKQGVEAATKVKTLETDNKKLTDENKVLTENYNTERVLRKKYYNMVEDMKGKIRVYCRARPLSSTETGRGNYSVLRSPDEFSINVDTQKGTKEFQFDAIFMEDSSQEKVFEDTNNLIQSAIDGYNVCIFAYGQTGSGKTFTMIGDRQQQFPGIAPRAFKRIFELIHELRNKFTITVSSYMLELYNEKLIDLYAKPGTSDDERMEIKKDKKGLVFVQGAITKTASNDKELFALFEEGSKNRHTASTKMNSESSRSHLVVGITMEVTNKTTGQVLKGKLSLVDLAGSERVGKTGATAEQLKEAMSINKSLSALGDVISALSSDQQFIPYRNNKLTMLMQDSLGGNAKTLMFVNISPADYNQDETVISLMYASRVKLITNDASKNADNKEIARLKAIIAKLRAGESIDEEV